MKLAYLIRVLRVIAVFVLGLGMGGASSSNQLPLWAKATLGLCAFVLVIGAASDYPRVENVAPEPK